MHLKESSKIGEVIAILFPNLEAGKSIAFVERGIPRKMPTRVAKKKTEKPVQRQLELEFNEPETQDGQVSVESDNEELFREGFSSFDVGSQRVDWDWQNRLKMMEAESKQAIATTQPTPGTKRSKRKGKKQR